jgi:hypothetical protein
MTWGLSVRHTRDNQRHPEPRGGVTDSGRVGGGCRLRERERSDKWFGIDLVESCLDLPKTRRPDYAGGQVASCMGPYGDAVQKGYSLSST